MVIKRIDSVTGCIIGVFLYELGTLIFFYQPFILPTLFHIIGIVITLYFLLTAKYHRIESPLAPVFGLFCFWTVIMLLRGSLMGNAPIGRNVSIISIIDNTIKNPFSWIAFIMPLIARLDFNFKNFSLLVKLGVAVSIVSLVSVILMRDMIFMGYIEGRTNIIGLDGEYLLVRRLITSLLPCYGLVVFFSFCSYYLKLRLRILFISIIFVDMLGMVVGGARGGSVLDLGYLATVFYLLYKSQSSPTTLSRNNSTKLMNKMIIILFVSSVIYGLIYMASNTSTFDFLFSRLFESGEVGELADFNRENITDDFVRDFNNHPMDWIFGRGVNGSYICTASTISENGRREAMEWGYLYMILKGGIIYLVLGAYLFLHAAWKGLFHSKNIFSKACAFMCLWQVLCLVTTRSEPEFALFYVLSWLCFGLLENKRIRYLTDFELWGYFNNKGFSRK